MLVRIVPRGECARRRVQYATLAQVIPVVFILLAVEIRLFRPPEEKASESLTQAYLLALVAVSLIVAELICLTSLWNREEPSELAVAIIWMSLGFAGSFIVGAFLMPRWQVLKQSRASRRYLALVFLAMFAALVLSVVEVIDAEMIYVVAAIGLFVGFIVTSFVEDFRGAKRRSRRHAATATTPPAAKGKLERLVGLAFVGWVLTGLRRRRT